MPNLKNLISRISWKIADGPAHEILISKFDLDYAYGQQRLSKELWTNESLQSPRETLPGITGFWKAFTC